jgi:ADP-glucose pyrophosphorylase
MQPWVSRGRVPQWYRGTADAVLRNMQTIEEHPGDLILVLAGDHIYKMDYRPFIAAHTRRRADVTIAVRRVPLADASRMGILAMDEHLRVSEWQEKPKQPKSDLASMGIYVFSKKALRTWLSDERTDFGSNVIPDMIDGGARVFAHVFNGYWQDVGTIQAYWETHMALRKRTVDPERVERMVSGIVRLLESTGESEIGSEQIGHLVMEGLRGLDDVAYVRFASVYRNFREAKDFETFIGELSGEPMAEQDET